MEFTKVQITEILTQVASEENGFHTLMELMLNAMMRSERNEFLRENRSTGNKGNGYRTATVFGQGRLLELRVPRDRQGVFYPVLLGVLRAQEDACERLAASLYTKGLTQKEVGEVFEEVYGAHYSKSSISRMLEEVRQEVEEWRTRKLDAAYRILYIDAIQVKVRRDTVASEAFYVVLGVKPDKTREVLAIECIPQESATGWQDLLQNLRNRGVEEVKLVVADGLKGLETAVAAVFPQADFQKCVTHLKRNVLSKVRSEDKAELASDLRTVFATDNTDDTPEKGIERWKGMCRKWKSKYKTFATLENSMEHTYYFTYLKFDARVRSMLYTTNWIERLNKDFRRVLKFRNAMPNEESVLTLMGKTAMQKKAYDYPIHAFGYEHNLFPIDN